ncbi:hypothetical protein [Botrimarina hoheduenensis]|uniref:hypothetical protein n=1 Tax=Botrimarina hoheduenensis TaxID=2528000 RepID=UPI0011B7C402|nr:hypothetical protein [Botrimarina hoheduenensis]
MTKVRIFTPPRKLIGLATRIETRHAQRHNGVNGFGCDPADAPHSHAVRTDRQSLGFRAGLGHRRLSGEPVAPPE